VKGTPPAKQQCPGDDGIFKASMDIGEKDKDKEREGTQRLA
jgi:hypothetical protein